MVQIHVCRLSFVVCRLSFGVKAGAVQSSWTCYKLTETSISSRFFAMVPVKLKHYQHLVNQPTD